MTDFPIPSSDGTLTPTFISSWSDLMNPRALLPAGPAVQSWPTANLAVFLPLFLPWSYFVARAFWCVGSAATGNTDIGIYTPSGARLWSAGSTAQAGLQQYVNANIRLSPGLHYLAYVHSAVTANQAFGSAAGSVVPRAAGAYQMASALPLPANATFAAWTTTILPLIGITRTPSGF